MGTKRSIFETAPVIQSVEHLHAWPVAAALHPYCLCSHRSLTHDDFAGELCNSLQAPSYRLFDQFLSHNVRLTPSASYGHFRRLEFASHAGNGTHRHCTNLASCSFGQRWPKVVIVLKADKSLFEGCQVHHHSFRSSRSKSHRELNDVCRQSSALRLMVIMPNYEPTQIAPHKPALMS